MKFIEYTVQELVDMNMLEKPMDGNHGNKHPKNGKKRPKQNYNRGKINTGALKAPFHHSGIHNSSPLL